MKDIEKYVKFTRLAAELGDSEFQNYLGVCYYYGIVVPQNYAEAFLWFSKAAECGVPDIQSFPKDLQHIVEECRGNHSLVPWGYTTYYNLVFCYHNGYGVTQNDKEAAKWYRKSIECIVYDMT